MLSLFFSSLFYLLSFMLVVSVIVFIHEFGHFLAARFFGVQVEQFSIGFGKELFSCIDKKGTKWKFCLIPMGGYVQNFGDESASSAPDTVTEMSEEDKHKSMFAKHPIKKIIIAFAGPLANFMSAWLFLVAIFVFYGYLFVAPIINEVASESPAFQAGLLKDDKILQIDGQNVASFTDIQRIMGLNLKEKVQISVEREGKTLDFEVHPEIKNRKTSFGNEFKTSFLGVSAGQFEFKKMSLFPAMGKAFFDSWGMIKTTYQAVKQLFSGKRSIKEMGGPIQIANHAGKAVSQGFWSVVTLIVLISMNLGFLNLLPIPSLDGSHILFYFLEMFCTKPGREQLLKIQALTFRLGMVFLISLSVVISYNDLKILILKLFN